MYTKKFFSASLYALIFIAVLITEIFAQSPCPNYGDLLNKGWAALPGVHDPEEGNYDEFAATDPEPFILKVNDYPPVKSFPIIPLSGCSGNTFYYFSFDTDADFFPINFNMTWQQDNVVKTYKIDQNGNYTSGCSVIVSPPSGEDVGNAAPDFVMKYNGTMHDVAWNVYLYPWESFVSEPVTYNPQSLTVEMNGIDALNFNEISEFIADINGGGGNYLIIWSVRNLPNGNWAVVKENSAPENYYYIYGNTYIFYDDEYKFNLTMPDNDIELKVEIYDNITTSEYTFATKVVTVNPEAVTFINHIETTENYGSLILNENHSDPISSGDSRNLIFGNYYTIRTNELPFVVDWNSTGKTEKHNRWVFEFPPDANELNHSFLLDANTPLEMRSRFLTTEPASIKTLVDEVELSGLDLKFNDPWFYYEDQETNNWYQTDIFKTYTSPLEMYNNSPASYGGIFLNQEVSPDEPYYSIQSLLTQTKNLGGSIGTRTFYFQNWSTTGGASLQQVGSNPPGHDQKAVVFTIAGATVNANYKGQLMSNDQNGISSGSQRKLVRTDNGIYHLCYESMGEVWYTHSLTTNFNGQWRQEISLDSEIGIMSKNPSIDFEVNKVKIVFETDLDDVAAIYLLTLTPDGYGNYYIESTEEVLSYSLSYFGSAKPVIAYTNVVVFVAYRKNSSDGLNQKSKILIGGNWQWKDEDPIPNTSLYSIDPSVAGISNDIHLVYQHSLGVRYILAVFDNYGADYTNYAIISTGSGYTNNYSPSISLAKNNYPVVSWIGHNVQGGGGINKVDGDEASVSKVVVRRANDSEWSSFFKAGNSAATTNNNSSNTAVSEQSVITWSEGTSPNYNSKWVRRVDGNYTDAQSLSHNGKQNQVSNGTNLENIKGTIFSTTSSPFVLSLSPTNFNQQFGGGGITKVGELIKLSYGREGVIYKNGVEFLFNIGDIIVGDSVIKFIEQPDTILYSSAEELNSVVQTVPFYLSPPTEFYFTDFYYVLNDSLADTALTANDMVNFKVDLVKEQNGQVVGTFDNITYTKEYLDKYANVSYQVNCSNISPGDYYLRLVTTTEGNSEYFLGNVQNSGEGLDKRKYTRINFDGTTLPVTYSLEQNYPNPFNPTTTIRYQIPKDGMVTLKIYDILGAEVATLVNEEKIVGRYEVSFDASRLASGVYIYRLQANDYISVKKMVLLK